MFAKHHVYLPNAQLHNNKFTKFLTTKLRYKVTVSEDKRFTRRCSNGKWKNSTIFLFSGEKIQYEKCIPWIAERKEWMAFAGK